MAPLLLELSGLEVEPLDVVNRRTEQQESLDSLTTMQRDVVAVLTKNSTFPVNSDDGSVSCCCTDPSPCCCVNCCC
jgi:hypothetical protein